MNARPARHCAAALFLILVGLMLVGFVTPVGAQVEPGRMIVVKAPAVTLSAGESAEAIVTITLLPDYQILASPPPTQWTTGATMAVTSASGVVARQAIFPEPTKSRDEDGGRELAVLTGTIEVRVPLVVSAKAAPGERTLKGRLRYQAHYKGEYYKAATRDFEIKVTIVPAKKAPAAAAAPATRP